MKPELAHLEYFEKAAPQGQEPKLATPSNALLAKLQLLRVMKTHTTSNITYSLGATGSALVSGVALGDYFSERTTSNPHNFLIVPALVFGGLAAYAWVKATDHAWEANRVSELLAQQILDKPHTKTYTCRVFS